MGLWIAGASLLSGVLASRGGDRNADAIAEGSREAAAFQNRALDTSVALARPRLEVGNSALGQLASLFGLKQPSELNFDGPGGLGGARSLYGDGDTPLTAEGITQAYRDILGRDPDQGGLQFYLTRGTRRGGTEGFLGLGGQEGERSSFTFNEIAAAHRGSSEYAQRLSEGTLPPSESPGAGSVNYTGSGISDPNAKSLSLGEQENTAGPNPSVDLQSLVENNRIIQFNRQQGEKAIDRGAAARGLNQSGGTLQDLAEFNQDLSAQGAQQFVLNPLFKLAGFAESAGTQLNNSVRGTNNNLSNLAVGAADARGSAFQNSANIFGNTVSDVAGAFSVNRRRRRAGSDLDALLDQGGIF